MNSALTQYHNCRILWKHKLIWEDLWVRDGIIQDPKLLFFDEKLKPDYRVNCHGLIVSPGYIDIQINGGFHVDFSSNITDVEGGIKKVARGILQHGVTSFCPTIVTSPDDVYSQILPKLKKCNFKDGAGVLGIHLEGPFISKEKRGAHPAKFVKDLENGLDTVTDTYGSLDHVSIVTLAPEKENSTEVVEMLTSKNIIVSLGHSVANLSQSEAAVNHGAKLITHLFNAMLPFHHRDPGLVGLLTSSEIPANQQVYYGIISDGIHTNPAALRIAYRTNPKGLILVTDAMAAMGLEPGTYQLGQQHVKICGLAAYIVDSNVLAGSIATMSHCVRHFRSATNSSIEEALEAATLHPALCLGLEKQKGTLDYESDADFILLDDKLFVQATFLSGKNVYTSPQLISRGLEIIYEKNT